MEPNKDEMEMLEKFEKRFEKEIEIVNLLNSLSENAFKDYFPKLEIHNDEKLIIHELVENNLYYLEQRANEIDDYYETLIAIQVFKALFMDKNSFSLDNLDKKKDYFNLVLKLRLEQNLNDLEQKRINDCVSKYTLFNDIVKDFDFDYYFAYCLYLIFEYSTTKIFFFDSFISFMKKVFKDDKKVELEVRKDENISEDELRKIDLKDLLDDLCNIYYKEENYYILFIDNKFNRIRQKKMSPEETEERINKNLKTKTKHKQRKKKATKEKNIILNKDNNPRGQEENNIDSESIEDSNVKDISENSEEEVTQKIEDNQKDESQNNEIFEEKKQNIENASKESTLQEKYDQLSSLVKSLSLEIDRLKNEDEKSKKQISKLKEEGEKSKKQIKEMKKEIVKNKKKHGEYNKVIKNIKSDFIEVKKGSIKLENELRLIQLRDVFKNIIDFFCKAYEISQDGYYIDKVLKIKKKISKQRMKEDEKIQLMQFFEKIYFDLQFSNKNAHSIDLSQPIIEQVFTIIDPKMELINVKNKLSNGKINNLLKQSGFNRLINFNNKTKLRLEEEKIIDSVKEIKDIYPNA